MIRLSSQDLEELGIIAQGARTKMVKSIGDLRELNEQHERDIARFHELIPGRLAELALALPAMLPSDPSATHASPAREGFDLYAELVRLADCALSYLLADVTSAELKIIAELMAFLEHAVRCECFTAEQRAQLFTLKASCEKHVPRQPEFKPTKFISSRKKQPAAGAGGSHGIGGGGRGGGGMPSFQSFDPTGTQHHVSAASGWSDHREDGGGRSDQLSRLSMDHRQRVKGRGGFRGGGARQDAQVRPFSTGSVAFMDTAAQFAVDRPRLGERATSLAGGHATHTGRGSQMQSFGGGDLFDPIWGNPAESLPPSPESGDDRLDGMGALAPPKAPLGENGERGLASASASASVAASAGSSEFWRPWGSDPLSRDRSVSRIPLHENSDADMEALSLSVTTSLFGEKPEPAAVD
jgi:hypothetical protein